MTVVPRRLRRLLRDGQTTAGVIVDKAEVRGRPPTYTVTYEYPAPPPPTAGQETTVPVTVRATMTVPHDDYREASAGAAVAVLYRPDRPQASVIPRFGDYEVVHP
jgi:Protein of unknown function (DUF3592)